jgi:NAD(P)-dependent dehydrogenase (short-subunit alcohol dehydrogenase family)
MTSTDPTNKQFSGKVVMVTGASSGIGKATAIQFGCEGASVACLDINTDGLASTMQELESMGAPALALACDISNEEQVAAAMNQTIERFEKLNSLCNVAGILRSDHSHELSLEDWTRIISINLTGTFLMCRAAIPHLLQKKGNSIVNTSSTAALGSHPWMAAYAASKGGILSLTRTLSVEYVKKGLRVNAVCPGGIATPLHNQFSMPDGADPDLLKGAIPFVRYVGPEYVASTIVFLASDGARYMNGTHMRVDGGALS